MLLLDNWTFGNTEGSIRSSHYPASMLSSSGTMTLDKVLLFEFRASTTSTPNRHTTRTKNKERTMMIEIEIRKTQRM